MVNRMSQLSKPYGLDILTNQMLNNGYSLNTMGMAVVDSNSGNVNLYSSDKPSKHIDQAYNFEHIVKSYLSSEEGKSFMDYVDSRGKKMMKIKGVGAGDLGSNTVAAIMHNGIEGILLSNYDDRSFEDRVSQLASIYEISDDAAQEYVLAHELSHAAGHYDESSAEEFLVGYFTEMADNSEGEEKEKYESLANVAKERYEQATQAESGKEAA
ncbi:hypothetical protein HN385_03515 [archaeon]|jgi:hypothetical protein|nr:hypothetical protein [archaeon]MBT6869765.1 hypothetical protein [archaeon]MBT7192720.1 hypothetical protein [archaeon]MBT7380745.1 hypothetical protein [archaeon]MBT7508319.1 hypothetical protein [archaeon]